MKSTICKEGRTAPGRVTVVLERAVTTEIVKAVPAEVCENCGEYCLDEGVTGIVLGLAEQVVAQGAEVEIVGLPGGGYPGAWSEGTG